MSVNRPTNVKQKEEDINKKLQLYGIYNGKSFIDGAWQLSLDVAILSQK